MNILEKKCSECEIIKDIKEFSIKRSSKDGYQDKCKGCVNIYYKKYIEENKDYYKKYREENKDYYKKKNKKWKEDNKNKIKEYSKVYYDENRHRILEYSKVYREENKDYFNKYYRKRISNDPLYKLRINMRNLIRSSLRNNGYKKNSKTNNILGCSYEELLDHLNNNKYGFVYGDENLDIDHIIPLSKATTKDEIIKLNHYSNLQLLPAEYNRHIKRDNDFDKEDFEEWLKNNIKNKNK